MVLTTEGFFEVAVESWREWDLNPRPTELSGHEFSSHPSSFLTLPHLLDCLICTRNAMPIVLLLQMMGGWDKGGGGGWLIYIRVWVGGQEVGKIL